MEKQVFTLVQEKITKGTVVYTTPEGDIPVLQSIYIPKHVAGANPPQKIQVTLEAL